MLLSRNNKKPSLSPIEKLAALYFILTQTPVIIVIMKHITISYEEPLYSSKILDFYFQGMNIGVLDIETTGLNPSRNKFILGGFYNCRENTVHQIFAENRNEEKAALEQFIDELCKTDIIITYNGKHFDIPFIYKRAEAHNISLHKPVPYNLDLYLVINGHSPIKKFVPNLRQKTVENYMGLWHSRSDEISGAESVELYNRYEKTCDPELESKILLHNSDDIMQLARLLRVIGKCDFHKAMYYLGYPVESLIVNRVSTERNTLFVSGIQQCNPFDYIGFSFNSQPVELHFDGSLRTFSMKFPIIRQSGLGILDLEALGLQTDQFEMYPAYGSGFLVIEQTSQRNYMETNHFIKAFTKLFFERKDK